MILLPITQTHSARPRPHRPSHTLIPIQPRSRTSREGITQPAITSIFIDGPLARLINQFNTQIKRNSRRQPVRRLATIPTIRLAVERFIASRIGLRVAAEESRFESVHVGAEGLADGGETAGGTFAFGAAEDADGGFEEDGVGDVAGGVALGGGVLRVGGGVAGWGCGGAGWGFDGWEDGCQGGFGAEAVGALYGAGFFGVGRCAAVDCGAVAGDGQVCFREDVLACCGWDEGAEVGGG